MTDIHPIQIRNTIDAGDIDDIIFLHGSLYAQEYGFDKTFEQYVAGPLRKFALDANSKRKDMDRGTEQECTGLSCCRKER